MESHHASKPRPSNNAHELSWSHTLAPKAKKVTILYDQSVLQTPSPGWADPSFWADLGQALRPLGGRGGSVLVRTNAHQGPMLAVLRRYRRGGWMAKLSADRYFYTGLASTRAFREYRLLAALSSQALQVPKPLLASVERQSLWGYRQALMTQWIEGAKPLAQRMQMTQSLDWDGLAEVLASLLDARVYHPDLNANNILIDDQGLWWVIDFDRARIGPSPRPGKRMVARLYASMLKLGLRAPFDAAHLFDRVCYHRQ